MLQAKELLSGDFVGRKWSSGAGRGEGRPGSQGQGTWSSWTEPASSGRQGSQGQGTHGVARLSLLHRLAFFIRVRLKKKKIHRQRAWPLTGKNSNRLAKLGDLRDALSTPEGIKFVWVRTVPDTGIKHVC